MRFHLLISDLSSFHIWANVRRLRAHGADYETALGAAATVARAVNYSV